MKRKPLTLKKQLLKSTFRKSVWSHAPLMLAIVLFCLTAAPTYAIEYDKKIQLEKMSFEWKLESKLIQIRLIADTKGWVAIGFNPENGMQGANIVIGYVQRGNVKVEDDFGIRANEHIRDVLNNGTNNVMQVSGKEGRKGTTLEFAIPLVSGDENDGKIDPTAPVKVLLAFGPDRDAFHVKHLFRTTLMVDLKTGQYTH